MKTTLTLLAALLLAPLAGVSAEATSASRTGDVLAAQIMQRVEAATGGVLKRVAEARGKAAKAQDFRDFVKKGQWTEVWPGKDGKPETSEVAGEVWNAAIQAALDRCGGVILPKQDKPYYLDGPIVLKSGQFLIASPDAEIRLKPGVNTCMVRNANPYNGQSASVPENVTPDENILVEGGVWTMLDTANGNRRGNGVKDGRTYWGRGVLFFSNVRRLVLRGVTVRQSCPFALHITNASEFLVEDISFDRQIRDGVHVNGPAGYGVIRRLHGQTGDDFVALNAWDGSNGIPTFGPIKRVLVEDVDCGGGGQRDARKFRLLAGTKKFGDGRTLDCDISDCVVRNLRGIAIFDMQDFRNIETNPDVDCTARIGRMSGLFFERLHFSSPATFLVHSDVDGMTLADVNLDFDVKPDYRLVQIGPNSWTYKYGSDDPARWREVYTPDRDCTVRNLHVSGVHSGDSKDEMPIEKLVRVIQQKLNPDYPKTTPKGGTGKGIWIR